MSSRENAGVWTDETEQSWRFGGRLNGSGGGRVAVGGGEVQRRGRHGGNLLKRWRGTTKGKDTRKRLAITVVSANHASRSRVVELVAAGRVGVISHKDIRRTTRDIVGTRWISVQDQADDRIVARTGSGQRETWDIDSTQNRTAGKRAPKTQRAILRQGA